MDELIEKLTSNLGIDADVAKGATGKAMALLKDQVGDDLFSRVRDAIPGADEAAETGAQEEEQDGGGMLGSLAGMASGLLGEKAGSAVELGSMLSSSGLDTSKFGGFASTIIEFLKDKLGDEVLDQILERVPVLKNLVD